MSLSGIGSDHQNARCILDFGNRVCHSSASECGGKTYHRRSVSETGTGIYVVGAKTCPAKLLEKVVLFIGAPGRGGEGEAVPTVFISDLLEPGDGVVQGLIPGNFLKAPVLAHKGRCQPLRAVYELMGIPALDAQFAVVHRCFLERQGANEFPVHDFEKHLATTATKRARCSYESVVHGILLKNLTLSTYCDTSFGSSSVLLTDSDQFSLMSNLT